MISDLYSYIVFEWQPIVVLIVGLIILGFIAWSNWVGSNKAQSIQWILRTIYKSKLEEEVMAEGLFMTATTYLLSIGLICLIIAGIYLSHGAF
jgi:hypothetical protein